MESEKEKEQIDLSQIAGIANVETGEVVYAADGESFGDEEFVDALDTLYPPSDDIRLAMYEE